MYNIRARRRLQWPSLSSDESLTLDSSNQEDHIQRTFEKFVVSHTSSILIILSIRLFYKNKIHFQKDPARTNEEESIISSRQCVHNDNDAQNSCNMFSIQTTHRFYPIFFALYFLGSWPPLILSLLHFFPSFLHF